MQFTPQTFFILEPVEALELIEEARKRIQFEHELQYVAVSNAIGSAFSKQHKYHNVFKEQGNTQVTPEEREEFRQFLEDW